MGSFDRNDQELLETLHQIMVIFCMKLHLVEIVQLNSKKLKKEAKETGSEKHITKINMNDCSKIWPTSC